MAAFKGNTSHSVQEATVIVSLAIYEILGRKKSSFE